MRCPLYVDLDGTVTHTDLLLESALELLKRNPLNVFRLFLWLLQGRARLKAEIAARTHVDVACLPYNEALLERLRMEKASGRRLVLASASDRKWVHAVAAHLGLFDAVLASDGVNNLKSGGKRKAIEQDAAGQPWAYAGNSRDDVAVWAGAREVWVVNAKPALRRQVVKAFAQPVCIDGPPSGLKQYAKALRLHQWAKNVLLFLPLLAAHSTDASAWSQVLAGFVIFGFCASSTYVINDLWDLRSDRVHPRKRNRPFASGALSIATGVAMVATLLPLSLIAAWWLSPGFFALVALYVFITLAYSFRLKRIPLIDVITLAVLYTHRILAGGVLAGLTVTHWLLAVSLFMFLSLALVKRCTELEWMRELGKTGAAGRGYRATDLAYLVCMGISSGFAAIMVLALYIESQRGSTAYPSYWLLWGVLPVMMYWIMRLWIKTSRMEIHDDPLLFAVKDPSSIGVGIVTGLIAVAASVHWG